MTQTGETFQTLPDLSALTVNTDTKRIRDELQSLFNSASLKIGRQSKEYQGLVNEIAEDFQKRRPPVGRRKGGYGTERIFDLQDHVLQELQTLFKEQASVTAAFVPSYESRGAVSPSKGIDPRLAKQIALAFFESSDNAPQEMRTLSKREEEWELRDIEEIKRLKAKLQAAAEREEPATLREQVQDKFRIKDLEKAVARRRRPVDRALSIVKYFATQNAGLVRQFVHDTVDSFLSLPSSASQPLVRAAVQLVLQPVDASTYNPIAEDIHMDLEIDMFHGGSRYGRPASEQDVSSLVASFCADLVADLDKTVDKTVDQQVALSGCGTVYFDGMPVVKPELLVEAARAIQMRPGMEMYTEYEIISSMGEELVRATSRALQSRTNDELRKIGIVSKTAPMLKWSNVNALAFHRSATRDEVLAGAVRTGEGRTAPRMRAFAILFTDTYPDTSAVRGDWWTVPLEPIIRGGRSIQLEATVSVLAGGRGAGMGEDAMP